MTRTSLVVILAGALSASLASGSASGCAKDSPSGDSLNSQLDTPATATVPPPTENSATVTEDEIRFNHTRYPTSAVTDRGTLGGARGGTLTNTQNTQLNVKSSWESGSAVVVFYRGHW